MKKLITVFLGLVVILAACSKNGDVNSKEIKMGKYLKNNNTVAFTVFDSDEGIDKNKYVKDIHFVKNGKIKTYRVYEDDDSEYNENAISIGDATKMSNSELLKYAQKRDKKYFDEVKNNRIENINYDLKHHTREYFDAAEDQDAALKEERKENIQEKEKLKTIKYKEPEYKKIKLYGEEDSTGNKISTESFNIDPSDLRTGDEVTNSKFEESNQGAVDFQDTITPFQVYDKKYAGLVYNSYDSETEDYTNPEKALIIKVGKKTEQVTMDDKNDVKIKE